MYKEKIVQKVYHTISEVAKMTNLIQSTIRFYESEFDWVNPKRNRRGKRTFKMKDVGQLLEIKSCVDFGITLATIKKAYKVGYYTDLLNFIMLTNDRYGR